MDFRKKEGGDGGGRERERRKERERERNTDELSPMYTLAGDQTHNLGACHDGESDRKPLGALGDAPTT